jgi:hypothetical protein
VGYKDGRFNWTCAEQANAVNLWFYILPGRSQKKPEARSMPGFTFIISLHQMLPVWMQTPVEVIQQAIFAVRIFVLVAERGMIAGMVMGMVMGMEMIMTVMVCVFEKPVNP